MKIVLAALLLFCFHLSLFSQEKQKVSRNYPAHLTEEKIKLDGNLNEDAWLNAETASGFIQSSPNPAKPGSNDTEVIVLYDNEAIYFGAFMKENSGDSINNFLTERDDFGNADWFIVVFNTYLDGINGEGFGVTPAGVQVDIKYSSEGESSAWDAVWESATSIQENGWVAEIRIPYSALRFAEQEEQIWGINFGRETRRKRERSWWNYIDPAFDGFLTQTGRINNIKNIKPSVRLSFFPYASAYVEHNSANGGSTSNSFNGGMDVKYGISEAFTLDMTLIPDFGQTRFDNQVLNLSQFEVQFNENRQFFTEGVELFNKAGIFYTRRVGGRPYLAGSIDNVLSANEEIGNYSSQSQLLNATKVSGRNKKGLGIGVFNAIEDRMYARAKNTETGASRKIEINPLTNYNVLVLDQVLRNNSFVSLSNANVIRDGEARDANVSQIDWQLADKKNKYAIIGNAGMSHVVDETSVENGYNWEASFEKISGNFTFELSTEQISDTYNPNDLGFLNINNIHRNYFFASYAKYEPFSIFNFARHNFDIIYERILDPNQFANFALSWSTVYGLKQFHAFGLNSGIEPIQTNDFFETRTFNQHYNFPTNFWFGGFISTDYSRPFAFDIRMQRRIFNEPGRDNISYYISPRFRPNDKLFFVLGHNNFTRWNEYGFVNNTNDSIFFGRRKVVERVASINANYTFNNKMSLGLILRQYWSLAEYNQFRLVDKDNGGLIDADYDGFNPDGTSIHDISFNAFNIDLSYNWRFAPGSEMSLVWKNVILEDGEPLDISYYENIEQVLKAPQINNFSIKILYYIDYLDLKKKSPSKS